MYSFRTEIQSPVYDFRVGYGMHGFTIGSCFAGNILRKLDEARFQVSGNPAGVLYNPFSIASTIESLDRGRVFTIDDLGCYNGLWFSFAHHGSFSSADPVEVLERITTAMAGGAEALHRSDYVIITLGTAWVYEQISTGQVVANCHKLPAREFRRRRLSVADICLRFAPLLEGCLAGKKIIFTVSPIRHLGDGMAENTLSKSTLVVAVHDMVELYGNCVYFPAYEIMMDDLRDYRFYGDDMTHPSPQAIDYIWEIFRRSFMDGRTVALTERIGKVVRAASHRVIHPGSDAHRRFAEGVLREMELLKKECPGADFSKEEALMACGIVAPAK